MSSILSQIALVRHVSDHSNSLLHAGYCLLMWILYSSCMRCTYSICADMHYECTGTHMQTLLLQTLAPSAIEAEHVHALYDTIAEHWAHTRSKKGGLWTSVCEFIAQLPRHSLIADVGCGDGKYAAHIRATRPDCYTLGSDRSLKLLEICAKGGGVSDTGGKQQQQQQQQQQQRSSGSSSTADSSSTSRESTIADDSSSTAAAGTGSSNSDIAIAAGTATTAGAGRDNTVATAAAESAQQLVAYEALGCDILHLPYRTGSCDVALCVAVLHHLSTEEHRLRAVAELARIVRTGGTIFIQVSAIIYNASCSILSLARYVKGVDRPPQCLYCAAYTVYVCKVKHCKSKLYSSSLCTDVSAYTLLLLCMYVCMLRCGLRSKRRGLVSNLTVKSSLCLGNCSANTCSLHIPVVVLLLTLVLILQQ
jgi:SAM-dependent methyltransferase